MSGRQAVSFASRFIAYDLGEPLSDDDLASLEDLYKSHFPTPEQANVSLPAQQFSVEV